MTVSNSQFTITAVSRMIGWADQNQHIKVRCLCTLCDIPLPLPYLVVESASGAACCVAVMWAEQDKRNESGVNCGRTGLRLALVRIRQAAWLGVRG